MLKNPLAVKRNESRLKAVPQMYEALERLEDIVSKSHGTGRVGCGVPGCKVCATVMQARAALDAAKEA